MQDGPRRGTALVRSVEYGSSAEKARLKAGDVIVKFDGVAATPENVQALKDEGPDPKPGDVLQIVLEGGRTIRIVAAKFD